MPIFVFVGCGFDLGSNDNSLDFLFYFCIFHIVRMCIYFKWRYLKHNRRLEDFSQTRKWNNFKKLLFRHNTMPGQYNTIDNVYIHSYMHIVLRLGQKCFLGLTKCTVTLNMFIVYIILLVIAYRYIEVYATLPKPFKNKTS